MTKYAVSFPTLNQADAQRSVALVGISVGKDSHESAQFRDTIAAIKAIGFKKVYIMVACTLQAHTEMISNASLSEEDAKQIALLKGDEWVERNQSSIDQLRGTEYEVIRWNTWLEHPKFAEKAQVIENLYEKDKEFHSSIDRAAAQFNGLLANKYDIQFFDGRRAADLSAKYIKEESAVIVLWREVIEDARYIIYPVRNSPAHVCIFNCLQQVSNGKISEQKSLGFLYFEIKEIKEDNRKNGRKGFTLFNGDRAPVPSNGGESSGNSSSPKIHKRNPSPANGSPPSSLAAFKLYIQTIINSNHLPLSEKEAYLAVGLRTTLAAGFPDKPEHLNQTLSMDS